MVSQVARSEGGCGFCGFYDCVSRGRTRLAQNLVMELNDEEQWRYTACSAYRTRREAAT